MKSRLRLILLGAGDFAREVLWLASDIPVDQRDWEIAGFLDDDIDGATRRMQACGVKFPILGRIADYAPREDDRFVCCVGSTRAKLVLCESLRTRGGRFVNLIHPTVAIGPGTQVGEGVILCRLVTLTVNVRVGDFVTVNCYSSAGHDAVIEDGCTISAHCDITGHAHLRRGAFLGSHAAILPGARVGEFATVGAGSVVLQKVEAGRTVFGVPAKVL